MVTERDCLEDAPLRPGPFETSPTVNPAFVARQTVLLGPAAGCALGWEQAPALHFLFGRGSRFPTSAWLTRWIVGSTQAPVCSEDYWWVGSVLTQLE